MLSGTLLAVALVLIVILINLFCSPSRPKNPAVTQGTALGSEGEGATNAMPHPRSHLTY